MTPTPTLKADVADAAHQLATTLAVATGRAVDQLKAAAEQYAPRYAEAAVSLAVARVSGDAEAIYYAESDIEVLNDEVLEDAALAAITAQAAGEQGVLDALNKVAQVLVAAAVARLLG